MNNSVFREMGAWPQLFILIFFSLTGLFIGSVISMVLGVILGVNLFESPTNQPLYFLRMSQIVNTICWLLLSALIFVKLFYGKVRVHLKLDRKSSILFYLGAFLLVFTIQPIISLIGYFNYNITFPESMSAIEKAIKSMTDTNAALMDYLFSDKSVLGFITNVFIIAVLAAFVEEIFFRGCLQQILIKITKNYHFGVWITAFIFSAVHLEFYGFLPRILLGAMLGYLFVWSGSIWVPMLAHFINNLTAILLKYFSNIDLDDMEKYVPSENIVYIVLSIIFTVIIVYFLARRKVRVIEC